MASGRYLRQIAPSRDWDLYDYTLCSSQTRLEIGLVSPHRCKGTTLAESYVQPIQDRTRPTRYRNVMLKCDLPGKRNQLFLVGRRPAFLRNGEAHGLVSRQTCIGQIRIGWLHVQPRITIGRSLRSPINWEQTGKFDRDARPWNG